MKKKRKMVCALLLLSVLGFSGCQKEQRKAEVSKSDFLDQEIPDHVSEEVSKNFIIDADVHILRGFEDGMADVLRVKMIPFDQKQVISVFAADHPVAEEKSNSYMDGSSDTTYFFENGDQVYVSDDFLSYQTELSGYLNYSARLSYGQAGENRDLFAAVKEDFSYSSIDAAEKNCYEMLKKVGVPVLEKSKCRFRLKHQLLEAEEEPLVMVGLPDEYNPKPKEKWTEEDDCYYFEFYQMIDGCGIIPDVYLPMGERIYSASVMRVICNQAGIVQLSMSNGWDCSEILEKDKPLVGFGEALDTIKKKYEKVVSKEMLELIEIELGYTGFRESAEENWIEQMVFSPIWLFRVKKTETIEGDEFTTVYNVAIDAVTGEEIL